METYSIQSTTTGGPLLPTYSPTRPLQKQLSTTSSPSQYSPRGMEWQYYHLHHSRNPSTLDSGVVIVQKENVLLVNVP
jgi:hypothetical protein